MRPSLLPCEAGKEGPKDYPWRVAYPSCFAGVGFGRKIYFKKKGKDRKT